MFESSKQNVGESTNSALTRRGCGVLLAVFAFASCAFGQEIKVEVVSSLVWGEDFPSGAISTTIKDPLTGHVIHKLRYGPIEVSSRIGFERVSPDEVGTYLNYTTTVINGSDSTLSVQYGGISIDGRAVSLPRVFPFGKKLNKRERGNKMNVVDPEKMQCFANGFLSHDHLFSADRALEALNVSPKTALTVSSVIRDPRSYPLRCSAEGCHPIGTIRYYLTVNSQDYVFVWPGQSAIYCGK
ncbi:MAG TPA: hypothetical protein VJN89_06595 [Candidatus Acidoferrum sp.]|nr:hypothetical protein [Candidatus Acidoferrum sp.]